jgi:hypothetical protein
MVARARLAAVVVPGVELAFVDPELAVEKVQLLDPGVGVRRIARARREAHEHAHLMRFLVRGEQLAGNSRRHFFPFRLDPSALRGQLCF